MSPHVVSRNWYLPGGGEGETCRYDAPPMPTVSDVLRRLDRTATFAAAASWDPVGLQLGDGSAEVTSIAVCHEVSETVADQVASEPPDLLITYHPLLFRPVTRLVAGRSPSGRAWRLIRAGVSLVVVHTAFDTAAGGTAEALANGLGLAAIQPFGPAGPTPAHKIVTFVPESDVDTVVAAMTAAGGGQIGNYSGCHYRSEGEGVFVAGEGSDPRTGSRGENTVAEIRLEMGVPPGTRDRVVAALVAAHPYEEPAFDVYESVSNERFIGRVGAFSGTFDELVERAGTLCGGHGLRVSRASEHAQTVAVLPGSGSSFLSAAAAAGADVIVTGDVDHHRSVEARDRGISVIDPGHAATERPGMAALVALVRAACPDLEVRDLTDDDPTPWR